MIKFQVSAHECADHREFLQSITARCGSKRPLKRYGVSSLKTIGALSARQRAEIAGRLGKPDARSGR